MMIKNFHQHSSFGLHKIYNSTNSAILIKKTITRNNVASVRSKKIN
jgi:hypothetical protein